MKKRRRKKGMTQEQLAKACGVSFGYIAQIEAGRSISEQTARRIARELACRFDKLFKPCPPVRRMYEVR